MQVFRINIRIAQSDSKTTCPAKPPDILITDQRLPSDISSSTINYVAFLKLMPRQPLNMRIRNSCYSVHIDFTILNIRRHDYWYALFRVVRLMQL